MSKISSLTVPAPLPMWSEIQTLCSKVRALQVYDIISSPPRLLTGKLFNEVARGNISSCLYILLLELLILVPQITEITISLEVSN